MLPGYVSEYGEDNLGVLQLVLEVTNSVPPTNDDIIKWETDYMGGAKLAGRALEPAWSNFRANPNSMSLPKVYIIDPSTMEVVSYGTGIDDEAIDQLINK